MAARSAPTTAVAMAIPAAVPGFIPAGFDVELGMAEGLEVDGMAEVVALDVIGACDEEDVTEVVALVVVEVCDEEGEAEEEVDEVFGDEVLVELVERASSRNANFTGMESILSGTMVPSEGKEN
jgi:hypothetical protein